MTWTRIGDDFTDKPEILGLDGDTFRLHIEGLVWCNKHLTDGRLPTVALARITAHPDAAAGVAALVSAGLWTETEDGWLVDWSEQETADRVEGRRIMSRAEMYDGDVLTAEAEGLFVQPRPELAEQYFGPGRTFGRDPEPTQD